MVFYAVLGMNESPTYFTKMHDSFESAEKEFNSIWERILSKNNASYTNRMKSLDLCVTEIHSSSELMRKYKKSFSALSIQSR